MIAILRESTNRQSGVCLLRSRAIALFVFGIFLRSAAHAAPACVGDCDDSGGVSVAELVRGVDIALGSTPLDDCGAFDANGDRRLTVEELVEGVDSAIHRCSRPTPTATSTPVPEGPPEIGVAPPSVSFGCAGNFEISVSNSGGAGST